MSTRKVTITDVAREAGVAVGTVSNALNHPERVRPETLALIEQAIDRLGYAPNQSARMLAGGHNKLFGLVIPNVNHGISLQIINGATTEARKHGFDLIIAHAGNDAADGHRYLRYFMGLQLSGILIQAPPSNDWEPIPVGNAPACPVVYLDYHGSRPGYFVAADNHRQGQIMAEHALACGGGATRIAVVGRASSPALQLRMEGVQAAMVLHPEAALERIDEGAPELARDGFALGRALAERAPEAHPEVIIALTDALATGIIAGVQAAGLQVPGDIRVCGCDGNPLAWNGTVTLTTITPPGYEIGRKGVQSLMHQLDARVGAAAHGVNVAGKAPVHTTHVGECESASGLSRERAVQATDACCHQELVRPLLLARASSSSLLDGSQAGPDLDISGYL